MSADLLLELPSKVVKVFALPQATGAAFQKAAIVIVQADSVSVAHGENGSLYHHYNFGRKTNYGAIVDCVYLLHQRQFLVAFQDSSLVVVPLECKDVALCERAVWPKQPLKLQSADGKSVSMYCDGGYMCVLTISSEGSLPGPPSTWSERSLTQIAKESVFFQANSRHVAAVSLRSAPAASTSVTPAKRKAKAQKESDADNSEYLLSVWPVPALLNGASALLTAQSASTATLSLQAGESVVSVVLHARADSLSVVTSLEGKTSGKWLKVALDGTVLFERALSAITANVGDYSEVGEQLVVLNSERVLKYFDARYGTEVRSVALNDSTGSSPVSASWVLLFESDSNKSSSAATPTSVQIFTSKMLKASGPFNLYRRALGVQTASALSSSLCHSVGKLATGASAVEGGAAVSAAQKRQLQEVAAQYQVQVQKKAAQDSKDLVDAGERQDRKHRRLTVDVSQEAAKVYLASLETRSKDSSLENWEWDVIKALARSGDLSISRNPSLITTAAAAKRLDVLAAIVEYVPDLSEKLCVRILAHLMLVAESDLAHLVVANGVIQWSEQESVSENGTAKKKAKKGTKAEETSGNVDASSEDRRLQLLRAFVEGTLRRASAFSAILLGEAVRVLPLPCAVLLLQVVTHFMRGLCAAASDNDDNFLAAHVPVLDSSKVHLHAYVTDEEIKRAATWAEALLDGHFSALALHAVSHAATRRALTYAMSTISGAEDSSELVQSTLGLWTHITRVIHNGGQQVKPITSLYQVEQLDLR